MNRSAKELLIVTTTLVWRITDDLPNLLNFPVIHAVAMWVIFKEKLFTHAIIHWKNSYTYVSNYA